MKKMYRILFAVAVAATAFVGCIREPEMLPFAEEHPIHFVAQSIETRTAFSEPSGTTYPTLWTENDTKVKVALNMRSNQVRDAVVTPSTDFKTATFSATFSADTTSWTFYAISPASAFLNVSDALGGELRYRLGVTVPTTQTPSATSVDEAAQILIAQSSTTTGSTPPETVSFDFRHWTSYGKMSLTNLNLNGATIEAVDLTAEEDWAYRWYFYFADGATEVNSGSKTITVNTSSASDIWFACAPVDLTGKKLTVTVKTNQGTFTKTVTIPGKFESGKIYRFSVNMAGVPLVAPKVYQKVTSIDDLTLNSEVIIAAASDATQYAISSTQSGNNRPAAAVIKADNKITDPGDAVATFTVEAGASTGTYAFKATNGESNAQGYLYAAGGTKNNYLRTKATKDDSGSWTVTIGEKTVLKAAITGEGARNLLQYNPNNGSPIFNCYGVNAASRDSVAIYKLVGSGGDEPPVEKKDCGLWLEETSYTISVGESVEIALDGTKLDPDYIDDGGTITYSCDDVTVAKFDEDEPNTLIGIKAGTCTVTVTASETEHFKPATKTCEITVKSDEAKTLPYEEPLTNTLGDFTIEDKTLPTGLNFVWGDKPNGYAKGSAYYSSTYYKAESWLISPQIDLTSATQAVVSFDYAINYGVSSSYSSQFYLQVFDGTTWSMVTIPGLPTSGSWTFYEAVVDLTSYVGKTIKVAFVYNSTGLDGAAPTIEVNHFKINTLADCKISVAENLSVMVGDAPVDLNATVNSGATLSYVSADPSVASVTAAGVVSAVAAGTTTITVSAPATGLYAAGTASVTVTVADSSSPIYYTLDGTITGGDNGYATESAITQNGISWKVMGNTTMSPWRIGGKSLSGVDRPVYSQTVLPKDITKVVISHGSMTDVTVNSVTLIVSQNANFSNPVDTLTGSAAAANSDMTFTRPSGHSWNNCYFKIVYNLTVSVNANKFVQLKAVTFYQN